MMSPLRSQAGGQPSLCSVLYMKSTLFRWLDEEPDMVADPDAVRPEDWDDEMDGEQGIIENKFNLTNLI